MRAPVPSVAALALLLAGCGGTTTPTGGSDSNLTGAHATGGAASGSWSPGAGGSVGEGGVGGSVGEGGVGGVGGEGGVGGSVGEGGVGGFSGSTAGAATSCAPPADAIGGAPASAPCHPNGGQAPDPTVSPFPAVYPAAACGELAEVALVPGADVVSSLIVGVWTRCGDAGAPSVFGTTDDVGLELRPDGTWFKLYAAAGAQLSRGAGALDHGTWEASMAAGSKVFGIDAKSEGGEYYLGGELAVSLRRLRLDNNGVHQSTYAADEGPTCDQLPTDAPVPFAFAHPAVACNQSPHYATPSSKDEFVCGITGRWTLCEAPSIFGTSDDIGLELTPDGHFYKLYAAGDGMAVRGQGLQREGTWSPFGGVWLGAGGSGQINLDLDGGGGIALLPKVSTSPRRLHGDNNGVWIADYSIDP